MALEKTVTNDMIELVGEFRLIQVRTKTAVLEDGVELSSSYHRHVIAPGDDVSGETTEVQDIAATVHTQAVIDAYAAHLAAQEQGAE
jgi:hypothetical protein